MSNRRPALIAGPVDQHHQVAALIDSLRADPRLDPDEIAFEAVHDALLGQRLTFDLPGQRLTFDLPGQPAAWHLTATIVDIDAFEIIESSPATPIPTRPGDRRPLATITIETALSARLRAQIGRIVPLTALAATYWMIDDRVTLHTRAEICIDANTHRVKGAAVTIDPATVDLTGTAIHALIERHPANRYDPPWQRPDPTIRGSDRSPSAARDNPTEQEEAP